MAYNILRPCSCASTNKKKGSSSHSDKERSQQHNKTPLFPLRPLSLALTTLVGYTYANQKKIRKQQPYLLNVSILSLLPMKPNQVSSRTKRPAQLSSSRSSLPRLLPVLLPSLTPRWPVWSPLPEVLTHTPMLPAENSWPGSSDGICK